MPLPDTDEFKHDGALLQVVGRTQLGQEPAQEPDIQVRTSEFAVNPALQVNVRVSPSDVPFPDAVEFEHVGTELLHPVGRTQLGQEPAQAPDLQVCTAEFTTKPALHVNVRVSPSDEPFPDAVESGHVPGAGQVATEHDGQGPVQVPDVQVLVEELPVNPALQVYVRVSPSAIPFPEAEASAHTGILLPQLMAQLGQEPIQLPDEHVLVAGDPKNPVLQVYVRVSPSDVPFPDAVEFAHDPAAGQLITVQTGQEPAQAPDVHVRVSGSPENPALHVYIRVSSSIVPVPDAVVSAHVGAPPQFPKTALQNGQELSQLPDVHVRVMGDPVNPKSHVYVRVSPSDVPLPDAVESAHDPGGGQEATKQTGHEPAQLPDAHVRVEGLPVNPVLHVYVRVSPSNVPFPDAVAFKHAEAEGAGQLPIAQVGQVPSQLPDVHVRVSELPVYPELHVNVRASPSDVPLPEAEAFKHDRGGEQPATVQTGQVPFQLPDVQVRTSVLLKNPTLHVYVRVSPSDVPFPDAVAFKHVGIVLPQLASKQTGHEPAQTPDVHVRVVESTVYPELHVNVRVSPSDVPFPDAVAFEHVEGAGQEAIAQSGQEPAQTPDEHVRVAGSPENPPLHVYKRVSPSSVPFPDAEALVHARGLLQPVRAQVGQGPVQTPDEHIRVVEDPVNLASHTYVRISPSAMPLPDAIAFGHLVLPIQLPAAGLQTGQVPTQTPNEHLRVAGPPVYPDSHVYVRVSPGAVPLPDGTELIQLGALLQLPGGGIHVGQEPRQRPDEQVVVVGTPVKPVSHVYVQVFPSAVPLPDNVLSAHDGTLLQLPVKIQFGQEVLHCVDEQVLVVEDPVNPALHVYNRVSPRDMPLPDAVESVQDGAPPQFPRGGAHNGQGPSHEPPVQVLTVEAPVNPKLHVYVRVSPSAVPLPEGVESAQAGVPTQSVGGDGGGAGGSGGGDGDGAGDGDGDGDGGDGGAVGGIGGAGALGTLSPNMSSAISRKSSP